MVRTGSARGLPCVSPASCVRDDQIHPYPCVRVKRKRLRVIVSFLFSFARVFVDYFFPHYVKSELSVR